MKGLLLKDLYMAAKYCRLPLLLAAVFMVVSYFSDTNLFFLFYPCMVCGMIPITLLGYDENSKWLQYSRTMPYTSAQIVSAKYLIGLFAQLAMLLLTAIVQAVRMSVGGGFVLGEYLVLLMTLTVLSLVSSSISLPFMFKLGVQKGRLAYFVMVGLATAASVSAGTILGEQMPEVAPVAGMILPVFCLVGIGIYALSWYLSIVFFKKRGL